MAPEIREAAVDDAATVVALVHQFKRQEDESAARLTVADVLAHGFGERRRFGVLLAEDAGQALGYALFYPSAATHSLDSEVVAARGTGAPEYAWNYAAGDRSAPVWPLFAAYTQHATRPGAEN